MPQYSEYFLSTGEFARLSSTTKDTLRHYHEMGLIVPQKNEENGYHYYSLSQITSFYFINIFRQLDTPLKNIKTFLTTTDDEEYYDFCRGQLNNLIKMRSEIDYKIAALTNATLLMHHMKQTPEGVPHSRTLSEKIAYLVTPIQSKRSGGASDIVEDIRRHIERCNNTPAVHTFPIGGTIDYEDFCNGNYRYKDLCSHVSSNMEGEDIRRLPTRTVVGCSCNDSTTDIKNIYQNMQKFVEENKLTVLSDLFSISLFNFVDVQAEHRYLKYLYLCIESV